jgi:hypothetical protein
LKSLQKYPEAQQVFAAAQITIGENIGVLVSTCVDGSQISDTLSMSADIRQQQTRDPTGSAGRSIVDITSAFRALFRTTEKPDSQSRRFNAAIDWCVALRLPRTACVRMVSRPA